MDLFEAEGSLRQLIARLADCGFEGRMVIDMSDWTEDGEEEFIEEVLEKAGNLEVWTH